jgi:hypothetical protein
MMAATSATNGLAVVIGLLFTTVTKLINPDLYD